MRVLPEAANMLSFIICLILLTTTTLFIAVNLKILGRLLYSLYGRWTDHLQSLMLGDRFEDSRWKERGNKLRQAERSKRKEPPASNWWYLGFIFVLLVRLHKRFWRAVWERLVAVFAVNMTWGSGAPRPPPRPPSPRRGYPTAYGRGARSDILYNAFLGNRRMDVLADQKAKQIEE
ncbi:hypothetical protein HOY82DRAFT_317624 [Tuber indicum]|nr:hypothetical protein HOY82DRAFT_317624 [Tuber indicum]